MITTNRVQIEANIGFIFFILLLLCLLFIVNVHSVNASATGMVVMNILQRPNNTLNVSDSISNSEPTEGYGVQSNELLNYVHESSNNSNLTAIKTNNNLITGNAVGSSDLINDLNDSDSLLFIVALILLIIVFYLVYRLFVKK